MTEHLLKISLWILPILIAVIFHEVAHGLVANWLGDSISAFDKSCSKAASMPARFLRMRRPR